ncbi:MAG: glycosyltransferase family 39 protein [Elusimicrobia bacterium]|nr:glycosyltransferase family 39 protein [Elusimicrobiota bacterium]
MILAPNPKEWRVVSLTLLVGALLCGGLLRTGAARVSAGVDEFFNGEWEYYGIGVQLAETGQFRPLPGWLPTAFRLPLQPTAVSLTRKLSPGMRTLRLVHAVMDTVAIVAVYAVAAGLAGGLAGGVAACLYAFSGPAIEQVAAPNIETFFGLLVTLALVGWTQACRRQGAAGAVVSGGLLGLTLSCRSTLVLFPLALAWVLPAVGWRQRLRNLALITGVSLLFVLPWTLRNAGLFKAFIPFEDGAVSLNLWGASVGLLKNPQVAALVQDPEYRDFLMEAQKAPDRKRARVFLEESFKNIMRHPGRFLKGFFSRLPILWSEHWPLLLLSLPLFLCLGEKRKEVALPAGAWVLVLVLGYFSLQAFMGATPRYFRPAAGAACAAAGVGLAGIWRRFSVKGSRTGEVQAVQWPLRACSGAVFLCAAVWAVSAGQNLAEAWSRRGRLRAVPTEYGSAAGYYDALKRAGNLAVDFTFKNRTSDADYLLSELLALEPGFTEARWNRAWLRRLVGDRNGRSADLRVLAVGMEFPKGLPDPGAVQERLSEF